MNYTPPELIKKDDDPKPYHDAWSVGAMTFHFLGSRLPFNAENDRELAMKILNDNLKFGPTWKPYSVECKEFVRKLLKKKVEERMTLEEALGEKWLKERAKMDENYGKIQRQKTQKAQERQKSAAKMLLSRALSKGL